jgi:hypothetical protein
MLELKPNTDYSGQDILLKVNGKKEPRPLVRTTAKSAFYLDGDKTRYTAFKNCYIYDPSVNGGNGRKKELKPVTQYNLWGGHMSDVPVECEHPRAFVDERTGTRWIDNAICATTCKKASKCSRRLEYKKTLTTRR